MRVAFGNLLLEKTQSGILGMKRRAFSSGESDRGNLSCKLQGKDGEKWLSHQSDSSVTPNTKRFDSAEQAQEEAGSEVY